MSLTMCRLRVGLAFAMTLLAGPALAQSSDTELAMRLANPIASLISVPFQSNYDCCYGPKGASRYLLNIQPVIPFSLNADWNLITRTIVPVISMGSPNGNIPSSTGTGDTVQSFFLSPSHSVNGVTWGVGPVFLWPTGNDVFGSRKWGAGPTGVILKQEGGWTYGVLANHIWSYAGPETMQNVNSTFLQPFLSYTFADTTGIAITSESTYDWIAKQWTVPVNVSVSRIFKLGMLPVQLQIGPRFYLERPEGGPNWGARFNVTFLFPR